MERGRERRGTEGAGARVSMGAGRERKGKEFIFLLNHHKFFQEKKRRVTIMKGLCHRKSSNRENKDKKEENSKIKTFQHGRYWQSCKKEKNQWTHKTF